MANRVLLGKKGSDYGLWVSKSGSDVTSVSDTDMLFATTAASVGQILFFQTIDVSANSNTTVDYKNLGGVNTYLEWMVVDSANTYKTDKGSGGPMPLTVSSTKVDSTKNRITVTNNTTGSLTVAVIVFKEAAA
tara:strand:- start:923 stop:1321 length:399 start_codon:yes stop_codon:yes gene_type:complete